MTKIIIIYSTTDGHTRKICQYLQQEIEKLQNQVVVTPINSVTDFDLSSFDKIVVGASIRYGKHSPLVFDFIKRNSSVLDRKPNAFFTVNVVARKPEKCDPETNPYLIKFLKQIAWKPTKLAVFAGKLNYQKCKFWDRLAIRLIMRMTKGPTDPNTNVEFTNWNRVKDFGKVISEM